MYQWECDFKKTYDFNTIHYYSAYMLFIKQKSKILNFSESYFLISYFYSSGSSETDFFQKLIIRPATIEPTIVATK